MRESMDKKRDDERTLASIPIGIAAYTGACLSGPQMRTIYLRVEREAGSDLGGGSRRASVRGAARPIASMPARIAPGVPAPGIPADAALPNGLAALRGDQ
jgi:hypothetical protein